MTRNFENRSTTHTVAKLQRVALSAATAGLLTSVTLIILHLAMQRLAPATTQLQTSLEAACVLLWPSAILMLRAQTLQGGVVLFLLSACLNAGYFVFAAMLLAAAIDKVRSRAQVLAPVTTTGQSSSHRIPGRMRSPRPIA